jgi:DNA-binding transcriptional MerR regulator
MADKHLLRISELAAKSHVTPRTIRFYVQEGLLPQPIKSHKTLALYSEDCIEKIKAIKSAQTERFLPLVVIRRILEQNKFDYTTLSHIRSLGPDKHGGGSFDEPSSGTKKTKLKDLCASLKIPTDVIKELRRRKWIKVELSKGQEMIDLAESDFLHLSNQLAKRGVEWSDILCHFNSIKSIVEKGVDAELKSVVGWIMKNPDIEIDGALELEEEASQCFIKIIRRSRFKEIISQHKVTADNAYRASADEGFALPEDEIIDELEFLENRLNKNYPDVRVLSDLALGYSCIGHLDQSLKYLRKVLKIEPGNTDAQVRMIWYRRFAKSKSVLDKLRNQLEKTIRNNPKYALGHAFLATWYAVEIAEIDDHKEVLRHINLCLHELESAERETPRDLHEWVIIQYAKGRIPFWIPISDSYQLKNINAFENIVKHKKDIDDYYSRRMPFFSKWLWPNVYYFYGISLIQLQSFDLAVIILTRGRKYRAIAPYTIRLEDALLQAKKSKKLAKG